jgi:hypothetical protein
VLGGFQGFDKIRVKLANVTPPIIGLDGTSVPQAMSGGKLVAVLKFRRNRCYDDALQSTKLKEEDYVDCLTANDEFVVSEPLANQDLPFAGDANFPGGKPFLFTFKKGQLPINAWNVVLQVIYRGKLGLENDDVVLVTKDLSEPTFVTLGNYTDHILVNGSCFTPSAITDDLAAWSSLSNTCKATSGSSRTLSGACHDLPLSMRIAFGSGSSQTVVAMEKVDPNDGRVQPGRFGRIAILVDAGARVDATTSVAGSTQPASLPAYTADQHMKIESRNGKEERVLTSSAGTFRMSRGVNLWDAFNVIVDGVGGVATGVSMGQGSDGPCPDTNFSALQGTDAYPQPVTITGWEPPSQ